VIKLEENYRSTEVVLKAANEVIAKNPMRHDKTLWTGKRGGDLIECVACPDEHAEAEFIAEEIDRLVAEHKLQLRDMAILYRSNAQVPPIEEALRTARIDYHVVGGQEFYDRKEVKDAIAYLKLLCFPHDEIALRRVINYPARGIGPGALERLGAALRRTRQKHPSASLWDILCAVTIEHKTDLFSQRPDPATPEVASQEDALSPRVMAALQRFVDTVQRHRSATGGSPQELYAGLTAYLREMGLQDDILRSGPTRIQAERRLRNLDDFLKGIERQAEKQAERGFDLHAHLKRMALSTQDDDADDALRDEVTLSTLHGSKGLEFRIVFLCGFEEELLPHRRSIEPRAADETLAGASESGDAPSDIEEERRLCYVGITRARERLYLSFARERKGRMELRSPSRFLDDIPKELLRMRDLEDGPGRKKDPGVENRLAEESLAKLLSLTAEG
jgi:DNA helicase-2/ATP-dependent DNA helicase PcrA